MNLKKIQDTIIFFLALGTLTTVAHGQCLINNLSITKLPCDQLGAFFVDIDFDHSGSGTTFRISGNGNNYGIFNYSQLPLRLGPFDGNCTTIYEFAVRDTQNPNCLAFKGLGKVCCNENCSLKISSATAESCNGSSYKLHLELEHNQSQESTLILYNNGTVYNHFTYGDLPLNIDAFPSSGIELFNQIVICASDNNSCCDTIRLLNPCICGIYDTRGRIINCDEDSGTFSVRLNFKHNLTSDSFLLGGNNTNYGRYAYADLPVTLSNLLIDDAKEYEFLIVDKNDAFCFGSYDLGIVDSCRFDCSINALISENISCADSSFYLTIDITSNNAGLEGLIINTGILSDTFDATSGKFVFGPLVADCETLYSINIQDKELGECAFLFQLSEPVCCPSDSCIFYNPAITENCENNDLIGFEVYFDFSGSLSDSFSISINGQSLGIFGYDEIPVTVNAFGFGLPDAEITISDTEDSNCAFNFFYQFECFSPVICSINNIEIQPEACEGDQIYLRLSFDHEASGNDGFSVFANDELIDDFPYGRDNYFIGPLDGDCVTIYNLRIQDKAIPECFADFVLTEALCCETCEIGTGLVLEYGPCIEGEFSINLNFEYKAFSDSFLISRGDNSVKYYGYDELPLQLAGFSGQMNHLLKVTDSKNEDCGFSIDIDGNGCTVSTNESIDKDPEIKIDDSFIYILVPEEIRSFRYNIYEASGKLLHTNTSNERESWMDASRFAQGILILCIQTEKAQWVRRVINIPAR